jgi:murein L,D-transpeptidase YcbB/YkuD
MKANKLGAGVPFLIFFCALTLIPSCGTPPPPPPVESARSVLQERVGLAGAAGPIYCQRDRICGSDVLPEFYRARDFRPAWTDDGLALANASAFLNALRLVAEDGLDPENYHLDTLEALLSEINAAKAKQGRNVRPEALADLEMLLTDAFLLCGSHLVHGQVNPETLQSEWFVKGRFEDLAAVLEKGLAANDIPGALDSLRPGHVVYKGLKIALQDYWALADAGGWPEFPPGPKLVKGDRDARVEALRKTLVATGDLLDAEGDGDPAFFDDGLERSVKAFQRRHGLEPDGSVGVGTATVLNVPAAERLAQIRANLERWRWITQDLGERYILVNVADFRVEVVEAGREILSMPAIVGTAYRRTPDFSGRLSYIEINPAWNVPPKLAREDILPKVRKNPGYLKEKGIRVFSDWTEGAPEIDSAKVDWSQVKEDSLSYKFRQDPGPQNALGQIKFVFPNKFDVYLHDTPERGLFSRAVRDFSSGCIRVERPVDLAEYVLRDDPDWGREKILAAMDVQETRIVSLRNPLGVHLLYWTAWLSDDGRVQFRKDIYLRDAALYRALEERSSPSSW